jgi:hypothetical protein
MEYFALNLDAISDISWEISKVISPAEKSRISRYFSARVSFPVLRVMGDVGSKATYFSKGEMV